MIGPSSAYSALPSALGNRAPPCRMVLTLPAGPRRLTDAGERALHHVPASARSSSAKPPDLTRARSILVVKLDFIGDWILTLPFLRSLRTSAPKAKITVVVLDRVYDIAAISPDVDRVIAIGRAERDRAWFGAGTIGALAAFRRDFLGRRFDLALVPRFDVDFNGALKIAAASGAPVAGFAERSTPRKAILNRGEDRFYALAVLDRHHRHEAARNLALVAALGGRGAGLEAQLAIPGSDRSTAEAFLASALDGRPFLAVAPFVREGRKRYPIARLASVVRRIAAAHGLGVVLLGSPDEAAEASAVLPLFGAHAVSAAGRLGLRGAAAVTARAVAFIGMDSGPAHIAGAVGVPTAVIFPHPRDGSPAHVGAPERFAPLAPTDRLLVIQPETARAPCADGCVADHPHCIAEIDEAALFAALSPFVARFAPKATARRQPEPAFQR